MLMVTKSYLDIMYLGIIRYFIHIIFNPVRAILPTHFVEKNIETQRTYALPRAVQLKY